MSQNSEENTNKKKSDGLDIFVANKYYPIAENIFKTQQKPLEDIKEDAIVVLDTNVLLAPYILSSNENLLEQCDSIYSFLVKNKRLIIPGQAAREFAKHRETKLSELYQKLDNKKGTRMQLGSYPLLSPLPEYKEVVEQGKKIDALLQEYDKAVNKVLDQIKKWMWDDPVSSLYAKLFTTGIVEDLEFDEAIMKKDLEWRQLYKVPPGYKDASKPDDGIGDVLIWHTILKVAKEKNKSVIFVSGEIKPDWVVKTNNQVLYPRYQLIEEFSRISQGQYFHLIKFSDFLALFGANKKIVDEVRDAEPLLEATELSFSGTRFTTFPSNKEVNILDYLPILPYFNSVYGVMSYYQSNSSSQDHVILEMDTIPEGSLHLSVHVISKPLAQITSEELRLGIFQNITQNRKIILCYICPNEGVAYTLISRIHSITNFFTYEDNDKLVVGYIDKNNQFIVVHPIKKTIMASL